MPTVEARGQTFDFPAGTSQEQIGSALDEYFAGSLQAQQDTSTSAAILSGQVDKETGAPLDVRTAVGAAKTPQDKLSTIQRYYPDAREVDGNYVFTDPGTGRLTQFNPEGFDIGDVGENLRMGFEMLGGAAGAGVGALGGPAAPAAVPALGAAGAGVGGALYDFLAQGMLPVEDTRNAAQVIGDAGIETAMNFVGGKAGEVVGEMASKLGSRVSQAARRPIRDVAQAGERVGAELPAGTVTGIKTLQQAEEALSKMPIASDIVGTKYEKSLDAMKNFAQKTADNLSGVRGETELGLSIKQGVDKAVGQFKSKSNELYDRLWEKIPKGTRVPIDNFKTQVDDIAGRFKDDPEFADMLESKTVKSFKKAAEEAEKRGGVTVGTLKSLRTQLGNEINDKALLTDTASSEIKSLYGALTDDLESAAKSASPAANMAWQKANNYYRGGRQIIDEVLAPTVKSGVPEKIARSIFGTEGQAIKQIPHSQLKKLMANVPEETQKDITSEFVRRMGAAKPGAQDIEGEVFSPATFMTNWNRLDKKTKDLLFKDKELAKAMDDLSVLSQSFKSKAAMANPSGTAGSMMMMALLSAPLGAGVATGETTGPGLAATALLSPVAAAKLMTSPKFVKWLAKTASGSKSESALGGNLGRLMTIAKANPEIREEVYQYASALREVQPNPEQPNTETE